MDTNIPNFREVPAILQKNYLQMSIITLSSLMLLLEGASNLMLQRETIFSSASAENIGKKNINENPANNA